MYLRAQQEIAFFISWESSKGLNQEFDILNGTRA